MKKFLLFLVSLLVGVILFVWILETVGWQEIKNSFLVFTGWQGIVILFLSFLIVSIGAWKWREILREIGTNVSFQDIWRLYLASFSIRFLAPIIIVGAELFQGYILKEKNSIPWSHGLASVIIDKIFEWTIGLLVIFFGGIFFLFMVGFPPMKLVVIFGSLFLILLAGISFFYFKVFKKESITKTFGKFLNHKLNSQPLKIEKEIFNFFKLSKKRAIVKIFSLNFIRAGVMLLRAWLLINFLGKNISLLPALSILSFTYLSTIVPIPTTLGSHEIIQIFAFNSLNLGAATATAFTMIIRGAELIVAFLGLVILFRFGAFLAKDALFEKKIKLL